MPLRLFEFTLSLNAWYEPFDSLKAVWWEAILQLLLRRSENGAVSDTYSIASSRLCAVPPHDVRADRKASKDVIPGDGGGDDQLHTRRAGAVTGFNCHFHQLFISRA
jgi:hypothetical protein